MAAVLEPTSLDLYVWSQHFSLQMRDVSFGIRRAVRVELRVTQTTFTQEAGLCVPTSHFLKVILKIL